MSGTGWTEPPESEGAGLAGAAAGSDENLEGADQAAEPVVDPVADLARERDEYLDALQRLKAEFDNYRKRVAREQAVLAARASERLMKELVPVLDDLERALEAASQHEEAKLEDGVRLVHRSLARCSRVRGSRRCPPRDGSTRTCRRHSSRSPPRRRRERSSRCCRRGTCSAIASCGPRAS